MKEPSDAESPDASYYLTVRNESVAEIRVKGSKFLSFCLPVRSTQECSRQIASLQKRYSDATHVCFAYQIGTGDGAEYRSSDAGEPAGSAGQPILNVIRSKGLTNVLIVVVRYFGGTKLGIGGLIRAYSEAAAAALQKNEVIRVEQKVAARVVCQYAEIGSVLRILSGSRGTVVEQNYGETVEVVVRVPLREWEHFSSAVKDATAGKARVISLD